MSTHQPAQIEDVLDHSSTSPHVAAPTVRHSVDDGRDRPVMLDVRNLHVYYGEFLAVKEVDLPIRQNEITALDRSVGVRQVDECCVVSTV